MVVFIRYCELVIEILRDPRRLRPILGGLKQFACGYSPKGESVGGNMSARYCYSVWLRHLVKIRQARFLGAIHSVAELGPGDSIGTGVAALLSGANEYCGLDAISFLRSSANLLDEIAELYSAKTDIPEEFPDLLPKLDTYRFPLEYLQADLTRNLSRARIGRIRSAMANLGVNQGEILIQYQAPWHEASIVRRESVDVVFSQAVMEHVEDIQLTYGALWQWLKPGCIMSHQIDFKSHGLSTEWNGHWTYNDLLFRIAKGRRPYLINREPMSAHLKAVRQQGFEVLDEVLVGGPQSIRRDQLHRRFKDMSNEDMSTSGLFIACLKPVSSRPSALAPAGGKNNATVAGEDVFLRPVATGA